VIRVGAGAVEDDVSLVDALTAGFVADEDAKRGIGAVRFSDRVGFLEVVPADGDNRGVRAEAAVQ